MMLIQKVTVCLVIFASALEAKLLIMTHSYNRPEFIPWQHYGFQKFLKDDYRFVVFNDAPNQELQDEISKVCEDLYIRCIRVPQTIHKEPYYLPRQGGVAGASAECAETIQYMLDKMGFDHQDIVVVIDSDMFLIRPFSIREYLQENQLAANPQVRYGAHENIHYLLPNLMVFNMTNLPDKETLNFNLGIIDEIMVDTGGYTHFYLKAHPQLKWIANTLHPRPIDIEKPDLNPEIRKHIQAHPKLCNLITKLPIDVEFYIDYAFFHFKAGSNWNQIGDQKMQEKTTMTYEVMDELINNEGINQG